MCDEHSYCVACQHSLHPLRYTYNSMYTTLRSLYWIIYDEVVLVSSDNRATDRKLKFVWLRSWLVKSPEVWLFTVESLSVELPLAKGSLD